jgi:hypothetical protein
LRVIDNVSISESPERFERKTFKQRTQNIAVGLFYFCIVNPLSFDIVCVAWRTRLIQ